MYLAHGPFSLMNRLPVMERGRRPLINDIQADLHPYEILHDVKKLLTVTYVRTILDMQACTCSYMPV